MRALPKLILIVGLGGAVGLGLVLYLIQPSLEQVVRLNEELKSKKIETKTLEQQILAFKTAQSDLAKATEKDRILGAITTREDLVGPVQNLELSATRSNTFHTLTIQDSLMKQAGAPEQKLMTIPLPGIKEVPFEVSIRNNFTGVLDMLRYLENSQYFTEIVDLELVAELENTQGGGQVRTGQVIGNLNGVFYTSNETPTQNQ